MNNNIKNVKLGAPESIAVNNCGTLENLDVLITERLESISFKGDTGTKNSFERAVELLRQQAIEMSEEEGLRPYIEGLPVRYTPYEYISDVVLDSTIDTRIAINGEPFEVEFDLTMASTGQQTWSSYPEVMCINSTYYAALTNFHGTKITSTVKPSTGRHKIIAKYNQGENGNIVSLQIDNNPPTESAIGKFSNTNTFKLFYGNLTGYNATDKFHRVTMKLNGEAVRDYVPVRDRILSKDGMYDLIGNKFYFEGASQSPFQCFNKLVDTSISLNIPTDAILNGGDTKVEVQKIRIPQNYQEIEYLQNTGTQRVTLDKVITMNSNLKVSIKGAFTSDNNFYIFNRAIEGTTFLISVSKYSDTTILMGINVGGHSSSLSDFPLGEDNTFDILLDFSDKTAGVNGTATINGVSKALPRPAQGSVNGISLFSTWIDNNAPASPTGYYIGRIYSFSLSSDTYKCNLTPCIDKSTGIDGMYDTINNDFIANSGTAPFIQGGNVYHPQPSRDYYWQLQNIKGNYTNPPTIDQRGNITMEEGKWAEFDVKVKRYADASWLKKDLKIGIFYSIKSSELRNEIVNNRTLADKIASDYIFAKNADDFCSNYTQVEWLRSNASKQYIASGIVLNSRSKFEFIAEWDSSISRTWFMGAMYKKMFVGSENATTLVAAFRSDNGDVFSWPFNFNIGTEYLFKLENGKASVNDAVFEFTKQSFGDTYEAYLFATNAGSEPYAYNTVTARIKMAKIIGYRHYLPALDKEGRPCMYDMISGQAFYNQGTGEFTYGPIKRNFELFI